MSELPNGWTECKLGEILISRKGKKPKTTSDIMKSGYVPYLLIDEIEGKTIRSYTNDNSVRMVSKNDVLLVWDGSIGKCASGLEGAIGSTLVGLTPLGGIPTKFLEYTIKQKNRFIKETSTGTGLQHINKEFFKVCDILIPPLNEQKRIVEKLDKLLARVEEAKARLEKIPVIIKRFRQSVLNAAVTGELTKDWREKELNNYQPDKYAEQIKKERTYYCKTNNEEKILLEKFSYQIDEVNNWIIIRAEFISDFITKGTTPKKLLSQGKIPFLKVYNIVDDKLDFNYKPQFVNDETHNGFLKRSKVYPNDVLMNIVGPPLGKVAIVTKQYPEWNINQALAIYRPIKIVLSKFLYYIIKDGYPLEQILFDKKGIVGQSNISLEQCRNFEFKIPPLEEQKEIVKRVETLFKKADEIEERYKKAKAYVDKLTQSILVKAFRGELVPQNPNDEPAEKLLERIREERKEIGKSKIKNSRRGK